MYLVLHLVTSLSEARGSLGLVEMLSCFLLWFFNVAHTWQDLLGGVLCSRVEVVSIYTELNFVQL